MPRRHGERAPAATLSFRILALPLAALVLLPSPPARAGGGPRNVLVVLNEASEESLEIGGYYQRARGVPEANLCRVQADAALTTTKARYQAEVEAPVRACIAASPYRDRIDYIVLTRGLPIRADFPGGHVALAALLQAMDTPLLGKDQEFNPPTFVNYRNPYRGRDEYFAHSKTFGGYQLYLATMLSGYWSDEAVRLVNRSLSSDGAPPTAAGGTFYLEDAVTGAADVRNGDFPAAAANLAAQGYPALHVLHSDPNVTGAVIAGHVNAGSYSSIGQADIASSSYPPGAVVCALESYGLVPENFTPGAAAAQTPVTWWVSAGVTGAHGTVSEPYNVAFPDGFLLEPYVAGYNLAETFYQGIPYLYWMNLVLGDPLCAPYATLPVASVDAPPDGAVVSGTVTVRGSATTPAPGGIFRLEFFADDTLLGTASLGSGAVSFDTTRVADGWHRIEVTAYELSPVYTQRTAGIDVRVDNRADLVTIRGPASGTRVAGRFTAEVELSPALADVSLRAGGIEVGTASGGSPLSVDVDTALLGRGWQRLVAQGSGGGGRAARSQGVDVYVVKAPRVFTHAPLDGPQAGGTAVAIDGWNLEPEVEVWFGGRRASVARNDANHIVATSPTGAAGPVDLRIVNPLGLEAVIPAGFTYLGGLCPATDALTGLRLVKGPVAGEVIAYWDATFDPCHASYRFFAAADPALPPAFPGDFTDVTASDTDGNPGGNNSFTYVAPAASLLYLRTAAVGTDGTLGP